MNESHSSLTTKTGQTISMASLITQMLLINANPFLILHKWEAMNQPGMLHRRKGVVELVVLLVGVMLLTTRLHHRDTRHSTAKRPVVLVT